MPLTDTTREEIARELGWFSKTPRKATAAIEPIINRLIAEARDKALDEAEEAARKHDDGVFAALAICAIKTKDNPHG